MKKVLFFAIISLVLVATLAQAQGVTDYKLVSPLPGGKDSTKDFSTYASYLFPFMLSFAALAALVMFVLGGIQYMFAGGNPQMATAARERITNALFGLLLAVGAVLILKTINPALVEFSLNLKRVGDCAGCSFESGEKDLGWKNPDEFKICAKDSDCVSNICAPRGASFTCMPYDARDGAECSDSRQCTSGYCSGAQNFNRGICKQRVEGPGLPSGASCSQNDQCASGSCNGAIFPTCS